MSILIKQVLLQDQRVDVFIENKHFSRIAPSLDVVADTIIDGKSFAILPAFYNTHTHAAMTLMRSYADDIELFTWLHDHIWPLETGLTEEGVYHGTRLAALEMIKSGTVYFNDMYWYPLGAARAVEEMGLRADISLVLIDAGDPGKSEEQMRCADEVFSHEKDFSGRVRFTFGPHAMYTVSDKTLRKCAECAREQNRMVQIHVSETKTEVENSLKKFGLRPVEYLDSTGLLGPHVIAVHCLHLNDNDWDILKRSGATISHCPISNMKLSSGKFQYHLAMEHGIPLTLGTDGASSNNSLSMLDEMKFVALRAKADSGDPTSAPAQQVFDMATRNGAKAVGLNAGRIEEGLLADCMLINLNHHRLIPSGHLISNMVYSADAECIDTVICDGKILMQNRIVPNEAEIIRGAEKTYQDLIKH
ncbi:MAG: amidohydrolase [Candidatus Marinimicrobia bacterium]|nr:amidohydrolase [Candidatus Neomarinimicrobiota bacterium]